LLCNYSRKRSEIYFRRLKNIIDYVVSAIGEKKMKARSIRSVEIGFDRERNVEVVWLKMLNNNKKRNIFQRYNS
jgi:hypothetical protein